MRAIGTRGSLAAFALLLLAAAATLLVARAEAQVDPLWDHYKVYNLNPPSPAPPLPPVILTDQFGMSTHQVISLDRFMNPVKKIHGPLIYPINDPVTHYTWWSITPQPFSLTVNVTNQFGDQTIAIYDAQYLLNPALKDTLPLPAGSQPPLKNHYKAYNCQGPPMSVPIAMIDQFDGWQATVMFPRYFLTPVDKQAPGLTPGPIVDPNQHYVCYEFQPYDPTPFFAFTVDQFVNNRNLYMYPAQLICVPTYKHGITSTDKETWGRLKLLYR
jgi:hypothetical protein